MTATPKAERVAKRRRLIAIAFSAVVVAAGVFGIVSWASSGNSTASCLPAALTLTPTTAHPNDVVELQSAGFPCGYRYPPDHRYELALTNTGKPYSRMLGSYPVDRDGHFSALIRIPANALSGPSELTVVSGSPYNDHSCARGASCAGYGIGITILDH